MTLFRLNSKIEMIDEDGHGTEGTLYEVEEGYVQVSVVPTGPGFKLLRPGNKLEVVVYDIKNLVSFQGVLESRESGNFMIYKIRIASDLAKFQRREYVRVPYSGLLQYSLDPELLASSSRQIKRVLEKSERDYGFSTANTVDLSGGGVRIRSWDKFKIGQRFALILNLGDTQIVTKAEVRHGYIEIVDGATQYFYGIMFTDIAEKEIDSIIKFVFFLMRDVRPV